MKKGILLFLTMLLCFALAACTSQQETMPVSGQSPRKEAPDMQSSAAASEDEAASSKAAETGERKLKLTINGQALDVILYDTPAANALYDMLPLDLTFEDFNGIEKIAYMDNKLPTEGEPDEFDPSAGALCLYALGQVINFLSGFS